MWCLMGLKAGGSVGRGNSGEEVMMLSRLGRDVSKARKTLEGNLNHTVFIDGCRDNRDDLSPVCPSSPLSRSAVLILVHLSIDIKKQYSWSDYIIPTATRRARRV